jgi:flotillin
MSSEPQKNSYLDEVVQKQQALEVDLKARKQRVPAAAILRQQAVPMRADDDTGRFRAAIAVEPATSSAVDVRITGFWRWQTVIVPPNAYVVHTRKGHAEPLHIGLGVSFSFDPTTDSFLAVPGAMQTILINAHCICKELQGLLVQGYVQWIIADFATAYKKLDFSDTEDPMRLVNLQLREQAEAAIKDKVATMGINDVLSDKQPIIEELTARLRHVAEGEGTDKGLGLRMVTVQIKEAVVSSAKLWDNMQKPFRADWAQRARLAELEADEVVGEREARTKKKRETANMETQAELNAIKAKNDAEQFDREQGERQRRAARQQDEAQALAEAQHKTQVQALALEQKKHAAQIAVERAKLDEVNHIAKVKLEAAITLESAKVEAEQKNARVALETLALKQKIQNDISPAHLQKLLIDQMPQLMEKQPKPVELKSVHIGGANGDAQSVAGVVAQVVGVVNALGGVGRLDGKGAAKS